jgi:Na+/phosphate symporter
LDQSHGRGGSGRQCSLGSSVGALGVGGAAVTTASATTCLGRATQTGLTLMVAARIGSVTMRRCSGATTLSSSIGRVVMVVGTFFFSVTTSFGACQVVHADGVFDGQGRWLGGSWNGQR